MIRTGRRALTISDPPFTPVEVLREDGTYLETYTRSKPWALRSGLIVVALVGVDLPVLASICKVLPRT